MNETTETGTGPGYTTTPEQERRSRALEWARANRHELLAALEIAGAQGLLGQASPERIVACLNGLGV